MNPQHSLSKEPSSDKREREPPDMTTKPEGKSLKTSGAASSTQELGKEQGTHTDDKSKEVIFLEIRGNQLRTELKLIRDMPKPIAARKKKQGECIASRQHGNLRTV